MIGTFQKTLLEYVGSGKEIKYIANLLKLSKLRLTEEVEKLENLGYLGVATQPNGVISSCWLTDKGWSHLEEDF
ncbi:hypothetical protein WH8501_28840 [Crocosphaera watsonii WH 8501]|uniref:Uncharacterized protein n=2 Tax=Crocosphaera watsonii TaxID=263511 RepID=T2JBC5_CROWT|nr:MULTISPECIES: hypothetical protein [Crocosphaera]NQZ60776.1 hypothetical protein [Crocosphaera sp.]CCQ48825.1 hypothetical protein CWATWH8502_785 [Crocosphaera watsonii WH 8502]CCQ63168.1 hypothetical protein CWATWH0401_4506 [Crocosphaera watsonii WH 0401]